MSTTVSALDSARAALPGFGDRLIGPDDPRYDEARALVGTLLEQAGSGVA